MSDEPIQQPLGGPFKQPATLKLSAKWGAFRLNCTADGVPRVCGGRCCQSLSFWPPRVEPRSEYGCHYLGPQGCTLGVEDRPVTCMLYPFKPNKNGTLVLHHRITQPNTVCGGNARTGPASVDAVMPQLVALFGEEQGQAMSEAVARGEDFHIEVPDWVLEAIAREKELEERNELPLPRSQYPRPETEPPCT